MPLGFYGELEGRVEGRVGAGNVANGCRLTAEARRVVNSSLRKP